MRIDSMSFSDLGVKHHLSEHIRDKNEVNSKLTMLNGCLTFRFFNKNELVSRVMSH